MRRTGHRCRPCRAERGSCRSRTRPRRATARRSAASRRAVSPQCGTRTGRNPSGCLGTRTGPTPRRAHGAQRCGMATRQYGVVRGAWPGHLQPERSFHGSPRPVHHRRYRRNGTPSPLSGLDAARRHGRGRRGHPAAVRRGSVRSGGAGGQRPPAPTARLPSLPSRRPDHWPARHWLNGPEAIGPALPARRPVGPSISRQGTEHGMASVAETAHDLRRNPPLGGRGRKSG